MALALFPQSGGVAGVQQTVSMMIRLANGAAYDPAIRDQAAYAISACDRRNRACQCASLLSWVTRNVQYIRDPTHVELLHDPRLMARGIADKKMVYGDCDDMSTYLAALLLAVGLRPSIRAVGYNGRPFQHVYVVCEGVKLDATRSAWGAAGLSYPQEETSVIERAV